MRAARCVGQRQSQAVVRQHMRCAVELQPARNEIHRGRADETGHEGVARAVVQGERLADLFDLSFLQHHDAVGHGHCFDLVMGDVHRGCAQPLVQRLDLGAHLHAQLGVEVRQRLVEQESLRLPHDGPAHGYALALAARELARVPLQQLAQAQRVGRLLHAAGDLVFRDALDLQAEAQVLRHGHVRVERVVLEHHRHVAVARRGVVDAAVAEQDVAAFGGFQPGNHAQQRRLAAAARPHERHELAVADVDVDAADHRRAAELLEELADADGGHEFLVCLCCCSRRPASVLDAAGRQPAHEVLAHQHREDDHR
ncbi:hypothetical protein D3C85_865680 [compost metagenome]